MRGQRTRRGRVPAVGARPLAGLVRPYCITICYSTAALAALLCYNRGTEHRPIRAALSVPHGHHHHHHRRAAASAAPSTAADSALGQRITPATRQALAPLRSDATGHRRPARLLPLHRPPTARGLVQLNHRTDVLTLGGRVRRCWRGVKPQGTY